MDRLTVFTDGGCSGNPGPGGWAMVGINDGVAVVKKSGGEAETTNNIMELTAVINALKTALDFGVSKVDIYTDSQYVKNGITDWIFNWKKKGWKTAGNKPVKNKELWVELDTLRQKIDASFNWVKGHAGITFNEMCDSLVQEEIAKFR